LSDSMLPTRQGCQGWGSPEAVAYTCVGHASYLKSVVREIHSRRSVGAGGG
jgi:hypothetical protein